MFCAPGDGDQFDNRVREVFGTNVQLVDSAGKERIAWRTSIARSAEGWGARASTRFLTFNAVADEWQMASGAIELTRAQRRTLAADIVETGRDLATELGRAGTSVRRVLDDLEVPDEQRAPLEAELQSLGSKIVNDSAALAAVRDRLDVLAGSVAGIGSPHLSALPGRLEELVKLIDLALDTGSGALPMRLHGAGARASRRYRSKAFFMIGGLAGMGQTFLYTHSRSWKSRRLIFTLRHVSTWLTCFWRSQDRSS